MVRVLHIINGADLGGISSMILNYYRFMDKNKVHFDFVTSIAELGYNGRELEKLGSKFYFIEMKSKGLRNHVKELDKLLRKEHFDAIHVHSNHTSYVALMVAWKNGIKTRIAHGHNAVKEKLPYKSRISRRIGIILIHLFSTKRLACSKDSAIYTFGKHSLKEKSTEILPNAIDVEKFRFDENKRKRYRIEFGLTEENIVIGTVGRMSQEKNHLFLVELVPELIKKQPWIRLLFVGNGDKRDVIEQRAKELGVEQYIIFAGEKSNVSDYLSLMDVFAFPSLNEGLGIVVIEAAAAGLPVIMSDNVPKELGFIPNSTYLSLDDQNAWIECLVKYAGKRVDSDEAISCVRENGYDIQTMAGKLEREYCMWGG